VLFEELARASGDVAETSSRLGKIERLASCLALLDPREVRVAVAYLSGALPQGSIGVGWASLRDLPSPAGSPPTLEVLDVDGSLRRLGALTGRGSQQRRRDELDGLFERATASEQAFLRGLLTGEIRQGALEGVMVEAIARAAQVPTREVRRAAMLAGDLGAAAEAAFADGVPGLQRFHLSPLTPIQPMLAQTADDVAAAFDRISPAAVEWKLDGARVQVHRVGDEVRLFTRNLADVTDRVPELVAAIGRLPVRSAVFDGEAIALRPDGRPHPFQVTMGRFGSRLDVGSLRAQIPLSCFLFDCLHLDGEDLIDAPTADRIASLESILPEELRT
jgi:DNA ligase-1